MWFQSLDGQDDGVASCYYTEQDFCYIEDDATENGQYIDLSINPERFTGYAGDSAHHVWRAIYEENCFGLSEASVEATRSKGSSDMSSAPARMTVGSGGFGNKEFSRLSEGWGTEMVRSAGRDEEMCEEKRVYYRVISGMPLVLIDVLIWP